MVTTILLIFVNVFLHKGIPVCYRAMTKFSFFICLIEKWLFLNIYSQTAFDIIIPEVTVYNPSQCPLFGCATFYWLANLLDHNLSFRTNLKSIFVMVLTRSDVHLSPVSSSCWHCIICWFCPQPPTSSPPFLHIFLPFSENIWNQAPIQINHPPSLHLFWHILKLFWRLYIIRPRLEI